MALEGLRLAAGTLTVLPSGPIPEIDKRMAAQAMVLAPLAVVPLAAAAVLIAWGAALVGLPELVVGLLVVAVLTIGSRAMHLDGLADTVDGLGSGWDRQRALRVMRLGNIGAMGAVALVIVIGLQAAAIGRVAADLPGAILVGVVVCASRGALSVACRSGVPAARSDGLGVTVAGSVPWIATFGSWLVLAIVLGLSQVALQGSYAAGVISAAAAAVAVALLVYWCVRRLGGVTGDVMGASIEVAFTVMIIGFAI
jgi:adenosylcobinamide-GDP ribazoletransferase